MKNKKKKGFTLIELIAAIAILAIAMVGISSAIYTGSNISVKNTKKVDTSVFAQNIIQTYKSQGKNNIKNFYPGENKFTGYCYFNDENDLDAVLENGSHFNNGNYEKMIGDSVRINKKYGAYVEFETQSTLGKNPSNEDVKLQTGFDIVRIYVKVINLKETGKNDSSLVFYLGR